MRIVLAVAVLVLAGCGDPEASCPKVRAECSFECGLNGPAGSYTVVACDSEADVQAAIEAGLPASACTAPSAWSCRVVTLQ